MVQTVYTSTRDVDVRSCDNPIILEKRNFLSEFRTELEKAKARRNLGIYEGDDLTWENIKGYVDRSEALVLYIKNTLSYSNDLSEEISTVKEALDFILEYIEDYIQHKQDYNNLSDEITTTKSSITSLQEQIDKISDEEIKSLSEEIESVKTNLNEETTSIKTTLNQEIANIQTNINETLLDYATLEHVDNLIDTEDENSFISKILNLYHNKDYIDNTFVTQASLKGETEDTGYIFVTQKEYQEDLEQIQLELASTLKIEENGSIKSLTVQKITSSENDLEIETQKLYVNSEEVAVMSDVPKIISIEQSEYDNLLKSGNLETDTYYYTYLEEQKDKIVTNETLESNYYTKSQVKAIVYDYIKPLLQRIAKLEGATSILDLGVLDEMKLG